MAFRGVSSVNPKLRERGKAIWCCVSSSPSIRYAVPRERLSSLLAGLFPNGFPEDYLSSWRYRPERAQFAMMLDAVAHTRIFRSSGETPGNSPARTLLAGRIVQDTLAIPSRETLPVSNARSQSTRWITARGYTKCRIRNVLTDFRIR